VRSRAGDDVARGLFPGAALLLGLVVAISGWHYVRNRVLHGKFLLIAYDQYTERRSDPQASVLRTTPDGVRDLLERGTSTSTPSGRRRASRTAGFCCRCSS
jgi:hypothetical protein